jgi:hypothetical protein
MSLIEDLKKELASKSKLNEPAFQVPAQTVEPKAAKGKKVAMYTEADVEAIIAKVLATQAKQIPAQVIPPQTMTHISPYPAGISKRTGKAYPAGVKWHAKPHAVGTTAYGGLSMDDIGAMLLNFPDANSLYSELSDTFEKYGKTSNLYKKSKEEVIDISK